MWRFAFRNLLSRPIRSLLALCGLTVAIAGMVGLFSVAEGIDTMVASTFGRIPGLLVMQPGAPIPLFSRLPAVWADEIRRMPGVHVVMTEVWSRAHIIEGKAIISPPRFLCGMEIARVQELRRSIYRDSVVTGRFLEEQDRGTWHGVISKQISDQFHKGVGDEIRVDGQMVEIVGIYHCGSLLLDVNVILDIDKVRELGRLGPDIACNFYVEADRDDDAEKLKQEIKQLFRDRAPEAWQPQSLVGEAARDMQNPLSPLLNWWNKLSQQANSRRSSKTGASKDAASGQSANGGADDVADSATSHATDATSAGSDAVASGPAAKPDPASVQSTPAKAPGSSAARVRVDSAASKPETGAKEELPVEVRSANDWAEEFKRFSADLDLFLMIMTSIGITIAVLGIVNTMLMSVTERFIEFGILKANGWSNRHVLTLITFESALLGMQGGLWGAGLGWAATHVINSQWPTRVHLHAGPRLLAFSVAFSILVGVLGGLYPAIWASRMMPMDSIRRG